MRYKGFITAAGLLNAAGHEVFLEKTHVQIESNGQFVQSNAKILDTGNRS